MKSWFYCLTHQAAVFGIAPHRWRWILVFSWTVKVLMVLWKIILCQMLLHMPLMLKGRTAPLLCVSTNGLKRDTTWLLDKSRNFSGSVCVMVKCQNGRTSTVIFCFQNMFCFSCWQIIMKDAGSIIVCQVDGVISVLPQKKNFIYPESCSGVFLMLCLKR